MMLSEKVALITGAGSGVGRSAALLFASEGARVVCADVRDEWNKDTVELVQGQGGDAVAAHCDVTSEEDVAAAVGFASSHYGHLDIMYNNAGLGPTPLSIRLEETTEATLELMLAINVKGVFYGSKHAVAQFRRQGRGGTILVTASASGLVAWGSVAYVTAKTAVIGMVRALAMELAPEHIRVNAVCPGIIKTNFWVPEDEKFLEQASEAVAGHGAKHPLGDIILPEDVAQAALYLASDSAKNVTGIALPVDGGYTAR